MNRMYNWTKLVKSPEGACVYTVVNGVLLCAPLLPDGTIEQDEGGFNWSEVEDFYPDSVALVNKEFNTNFTANV